ncbi:carboxypeptidase M32 [Acholeplasma sp. OttesenSCG-928-E16]|nr:carboxypeptidase M32 [Acholeplasma sp. OttesenSCG-928-E16]
MIDKINKFKDLQKKLNAYRYFFWLMNWDQETEMPKMGLDFQLSNYQILMEEAYKLETDKEYTDLLEELYLNKDTLDDDLKVEIKHLYKSYQIIKVVPKNEYLEYDMLIQGASPIWANAKKNNDFALWSETLEKIVQFQRKLTKYLETDDKKGYDILLDFYEDDMTVEEYDEFFDQLRTQLVPFVLEKTAKKRKINRKFSNKIFDINKQKELSDYLLDVLHFDKNRGLLKTSVHPFTSGLASVDTRITTAYHENDLLSNIFSVVHETGHAIYEQQNDKRFDGTNLHGGASMGIHESQSRLYENMIARSYEFISTHFQKIAELFPKQFKNVSVDEFYRFVNKTERSLIRIEADELTYPLHIMVRYELEKGLISGKIKVKDLPKKWNQLMYRYLKIKPKTDSEGVLQDIHWAGGSFGYFPTYALGTAYAAQIYHKMDQDINIKKQIKENRIDNINEWLKEHIHKYGASKTPKEIMLIATNEPFFASYYVNYLKDKYKDL